MSLVSIIVCIYNTEQFIQKCAESLFKQTLEDIEFIFVNDCTPDNAIQVLQDTMEHFPRRKSQSHIIHLEKNGGLENARKIGLANAHGKYIQYIDSDDYIEADMIERMYKMAVDTKADIVACDLVIELAGNKQQYITEYVSTNPSEWFRDMLINDKSNGFLANKLYKRDLFQKVKTYIHPISYLEDFSLNLQLYYYAQKIVHIPTAFYHYVKINSTAITASKNRKHFEDIHEFWKRAIDFMKDQGIYKQYAKLIPQIQIVQKANLMLDTKDRSLRKTYRDMFPEVDFHQYTSHLRLGQKIVLWLVEHNLYYASSLLRWLLITKAKLQ